MPARGPSRPCAGSLFWSKQMAEIDPTNPQHYRQGSLEVIDAIESMGLGYHEGNVVKYLARWRYKNGVEDLRKARWYLERLIETVESENFGD